LGSISQGCGSKTFAKCSEKVYAFWALLLAQVPCDVLSGGEANNSIHHKIYHLAQGVSLWQIIWNDVNIVMAVESRSKRISKL
jgi:hypothetical protein